MSRIKSWLGNGRLPHLSGAMLGWIVVAGVVALSIGAFQKDRIGTAVASGDTIQAEFDREYKLVPYGSRVKVAGVIVGRVTSTERQDDGSSLVSFHVEEGVKDKLGGSPTVAIRPTLVVGGDYYLDVRPGARNAELSNPIPRERTSVPVELDQVLQAITPDARSGLQTFIGSIDATLEDDGADALTDLLEAAPETLEPAGEVLEALRGSHPGEDLPRLVTSLESIGATLTERDGQLDDVLESLRDTTATLDSSRDAIAQTVASSPKTLRNTRDGLTALDGSLDRLTTTATSIRPAIQELGPLLEDLDPVLVRARPVVQDLRGLLADADPLVERLVPTARRATGVLGDLDGPVLDRLSGPIQETVLSPWKGEGIFEGGGNDNLLYEQLGYLAVDGAAAFQTHDHNGAVGRLMAGAGGRSVGGSAAPFTVEQYLEVLGLREPGPQDGKGPGGGDPQLNLGGSN